MKSPFAKFLSKNCWHWKRTTRSNLISDPQSKGKVIFTLSAILQNGLELARDSHFGFNSGLLSFISYQKSNLRTTKGLLLLWLVFVAWGQIAFFSKISLPILHTHTHARTILLVTSWGSSLVLNYSWSITKFCQMNVKRIQCWL